jgi:hypothetical protein
MAITRTQAEYENKPRNQKNACASASIANADIKTLAVNPK